MEGPCCLSDRVSFPQGTQPQRSTAGDIFTFIVLLGEEGHIISRETSPWRLLISTARLAFASTDNHSALEPFVPLPGLPAAETET